jgi:cytidylate kinase
MYRAVTLYALRHDLGAGGKVDTDRLVDALPQIHVSFAPAGADGVSHCLLNGEDVERQIRELPVSEHVSPVAAIPQVRHFLVAEQQAMGREKGIVMDGRDIGTTVFPQAELKVFVNASPEVRAMRRYKEMIAKGEHPDYEEVVRNIRERDHIDSTRKESPLRQAPDAIRLDNDHMTLEQQEEWLCQRFGEALAHAGEKKY